MRRVAVVFDNFGNANQPFLHDWYERLLQSKLIKVKGFTDKVNPTNVHISVFKPRGFEKIRRYFLWRIAAARDAQLSSLPYIYHRLREFEPSVIHILNAQQVPIYRSLVRHTKTKLVVSFRGFETSVRPVRDPAWKTELVKIFEESECLHFVSDYLKQEAIKLGAPAEKCFVIRRSVDVRFFSPGPCKPAADRIRLLAVGRLTWQKGYEYLLKAVAELRYLGYNIQLDIVGDGPERQILQHSAVTLGISDIVVFHGHVSRAGLLKALRTADIFVQASVSDALPNSVLEASACGLPIVSTLAGGIPEAVRHDHSGILVEPGSVDQLCCALKKVLDEPALRNNLGGNGRNLMEGEFSSRSELTNWEKFYLQL